MLNKKSVLITGASRGIGKAIAYEFAKNGYDLYLTCKSNIKLLEDIKLNCHIFKCDMGNAKEVEQLFQSIPTLDVIVNNVMATNLDSVFLTSKFGIPKMLANHKGKIINISSVWGNIGASMEVAYSASKGAVNSFTKALAKELAPSNIQVNAIACGLIDTDMNACFSEEELHYIIEEIPADRIGKPEEVARLCHMLAEAPEYLTGQIITMDGAWT